MKNILFALSLATLFVCCGKSPVSSLLEDLDLPDDAAFTYLPTDLNRMDEFVAIGQIYDLPKAHGGFGVKDFYSTTPDIPVYAMSDGVIYNIRYGTRTFQAPWAPSNLEGQEYEDYAIHIYLTKTAGMHYGHLSKLAPQILQQAGTLTKGSTENRVVIHFKAGEILAYIGTHPGFDVGYYDVKNEHYFANPGRYTPDYTSARPFTDNLTPDLREEVWKINPRTVEPLGGKINYDVDGTLSGNWFLEGTTIVGDWSKQLIIARHERYADRITISDGSPVVGDNTEPYLWWIFGNAPAPETVTLVSGKVKYKVATWWRLYQIENTPPEGTLMIEMTARDKMMYEFFADQLPENVGGFTPAARRYER
ncbi:MAG: hypothetical protein E2O76_15235 [Caldithrix sp.]|nr:MAG: hypothetical protein E2O76_15235 [Caldithrix sp.]